MRVAQRREFTERGFEPYLSIENELHVAVKADYETFIDFHNACVAAKIFGKFLHSNKKERTHIYKLEEPNPDDFFGPVIS